MPTLTPRAAAGAGGRRDRGRDPLCRRELRGARHDGGARSRRCPAQSRRAWPIRRASPPARTGPLMAGTNAAWRFTPLTQITPDNVGKLRKVWEVHADGHADQRRLPEALRHREHAAQGRQPALHLHREERHRRARCRDRQAGVAGRSACARHLDSLHHRVPRAWLITRSPARRRTALRAAGSSKGRWIRG